MEVVSKTIGEMIEGIAEKFPDNEALIHQDIGVRFTYGLFLWETERAARGLIGMGVQKGDRVALLAPNIPEWFITQIAAARAGAILVPVDPGAEKEDIAYILKQSGSRTMIVARGVEDAEYVELINEVRDEVPHLDNIVVSATQTFPGTVPWTELAAMGESVPARELTERERKIRPEDPVAIMYTSGTTGRPKGVVLDHLGLVNKSFASTKRQGLNPRDRLCLFFPAFHMFGNTCITLAGFLIGATVVMPCVSFDPSKILKTIYRERCTAVYGSPSMFIALLNHPEFSKKRWKTVKKGTMGGAPCPKELMIRLVRDVGVSDITVGYGITEASSWITMTHPDDPLDLRVATVGRPLECNSVKIVDPDTGEDLPPNVQGELCIRGFIMKSYYEMPAATAAAIDQKGWLHSGDLGEMDEQGYVRMTGRLKDVIVRDGIEIHPAELEEQIYGLPEVTDVQVFGFPYPGKGQEVAAWVIPRTGVEVSLESFSGTISEKIDREKAPHFIKFVSGFPMTRSGKVQKFRLSEMAQEEYL